MNPAPITSAGGGLIRTTLVWNDIIPEKTAFPLSAEQQRIVDALVRDVRRGKSIQTLGGYAGTGKTTTIRELRARLPGMAVCAFTGKAATMLRRRGIPASTIHAIIYFYCSANRLHSNGPWVGFRHEWILGGTLSWIDDSTRGCGKCWLRRRCPLS